MPATGKQLREATMTQQVQQDRPAQGGTAAGAQLAQKIRDAGETVSREIEGLRADVGNRAAEGAKGVAMIGGAGAAGAVTVLAAGAVPLLALRRIMPSWGVALVIAGGSGALAALLARRGLDELGEAVPVNTEVIKDAARDAMSSMS
jgi:hypothetical protein